MMKKIKLKISKALIGTVFLLCIIAVVTPVAAVYPRRILFMSIGDDLDLPDTTDCVIGTIKSSRYSESTTAQALFYLKIYNQSTGKKYVMTGMFKGELQTKQYYFLCPVFGVYFINVWMFMGEGVFMTTDTELDLIYRKWFPITMPNTEGEYVKAPMVMLLSPTAENCKQDPGTVAPGSENNPIEILPEGPWVLVGVLCGIIVGEPPMELPIGPVSALTISFGL